MTLFFSHELPLQDSNHNLAFHSTSSWSFTLFQSMSSQQSASQHTPNLHATISPDHHASSHTHGRSSRGAVGKSRTYSAVCSLLSRMVACLQNTNNTQVDHSHRRNVGSVVHAPRRLSHGMLCNLGQPCICTDPNQMFKPDSHSHT